MALNITRFKADLEKLIEVSGKLELAFLVKVHGVEEVSQALKKDTDEAEQKKMTADLKSLPSFSVSYEAWYSECLVLIRQIIPDRLVDFKEHLRFLKTERTSLTHRIAFRMR